MTSFVNPSDPRLTLGISMAIDTQLAMLSGRLRGGAPFKGAGITGMAAAPDAPRGQDGKPEPASHGYPSPLPPAPSSQYQDIDAEDWDMMFEAVRSRLMRTVGPRMGEPPSLPELSPELSASLVQAVVLDCVTELDKLHAALKQERSQRLTT